MRMAWCGVGLLPPGEVVVQVLAPLLTGTHLSPDALVAVAVGTGLGLIFKPEQFLQKLVATEVGKGGGDHGGVVCLVLSHNTAAWERGKAATSQA